MASVDSHVGRRSEAVERLHEQLESSLRDLVTSEDWRRALEVAARFHDYSFANTRLIWAQAEARGFTAIRVAGYRKWQELGRQVRKGEKGIQILAPIIRNVAPEDSDEEERRVVGYRVVHVFDLSQTDGRPLPEVRPALLDGELPVHWGRVANLIRSADFSLDVADLDRLGEANGLTDWRNRSVVVRESLPGAQRFKTALHELAHVRLHEPAAGDTPNCRGVVEVEAESVAFMVCAALGVDSSGYSLPYVATWSGGDLGKLSQTADRVIRCARGVIDDLEGGRGLEYSMSSDRQGRGLSVEAEHGRGGVPPVERGSVADLEEVLRVAVDFYVDQLEGDDRAQAFLADRAVSRESGERWRLGYAPPAWDSLVNHLRGQGVSYEVAVEAGVAARARSGRVYDRMRDRIVFPIHDSEGSPRGFAGRLITGEGPKYLNSPQTVLYKKSELMYGLDRAVDVITESGRAVVVEGYTDVIAAHQAGIRNTVATGGTALTVQQVESLKPFASTLTLAFDGDSAGSQAAERVADLPGETLRGLRLDVARLPGGVDPAGLVAEGKEAFLRDAVEDGAPLLHHLVDRSLQRFDFTHVEARVRAVYKLAPLVERLASAEDRGDAVRYVADRLDMEEEIVELALDEYSRQQARHRTRDLGRPLA